MSKFDVDFQVAILSLMSKDARFLSYAASHLKPSFFSTKDLAWLFSKIRTYYKDYRLCITKRVVIDSVKRDLKGGALTKERVPAIRQLYDDVSTDTTPDREYLAEKCVEFIKHELIVQAFEQAKAAYDKEDYDTLPGIFSKAIYESSYNHKQGQFYPNVEGLKDRVIRRSRKISTCPTGIPDLDSYLRHGGLGVKELGVIIAPPNRGKSMFLKHISEHNLLLGKKVLLFTLEMSEDRYLERFDMSLAGVTAGDLVSKKDHVESVISGKEAALGKNLHIKEYGSKRATVSTLYAYTENLRNSGWFPDLIVIDYADELAAETKYTDERHNLSHIYKNLRGWAVDDEIPVWTASQANRASMNKKVVTIADIAEDWSKAAIADVMVALCQTNKEYDEQQMRIFIAKNRDSPAKIEVTIPTNFYYGRFYADIDVS